ncbi:MAG: type I-G CRISPR-associated protein Cas8g2 [Candidatus Binataceae bacterium]
MSQTTPPGISVRVDPTNPGQFFACCGLLELADRLWGGVEGWFENDEGEFVVTAPAARLDIQELILKLVCARLSSDLTPSLQCERQKLEKKKRELKKPGKELPKAEEQRRNDLGKLLREGPISIGKPFDYVLDWWLNQKERGLFSAICAGNVSAIGQKQQELDDDEIPKTWAGTQQVLRIAQAALLDTLGAFKTNQPFDFKCVMRPAPDHIEEEEPTTGKRRGKRKAKNKVEPFYFDSRHGANALPLDIGFSPNELGMESEAFPAVELLCLIGLQRCRPNLTNTSLVFEYFTWSSPLSVSVLPAAVGGFLGQDCGYRFENAYRTDQRKHSGYLPAFLFRR